MKRRSLRAALLGRLALLLAVLLAIGSFFAYRVAVDAGNEAYDHALVDVALALSGRLQSSGDTVTIDLPGAAEQVVRTDKYDRVYYQVRDARGKVLAGDADLPAPPSGAAAEDGMVIFDAAYRDDQVRVAVLLAPCAGSVCPVTVAETGVKRARLRREILLASVVPQATLVVAAIVLGWLGVAGGLGQLRRLTDHIRARSPRDLRPIDDDQAPEEAQPIVGALNQLFAQVNAANVNQRRFIENAAHQLRTPLAALQAHTELALAQDVPPAVSAELEQVHEATGRTTRLANQLLALARAEPGGHSAERFARVGLDDIARAAADVWVPRALARDTDLGFELEPAPVLGETWLLREALENLIANAVEYTPAGGRVTVRTGIDGVNARLEVEDDGPGIPDAERTKVVDRFYRMPRTPGHGSGLGLAIVLEIVTAHGGNLSIADGARGHGCRVRVTLPIGR